MTSRGSAVPGSVEQNVAAIRADIVIATHEISRVMRRVGELLQARDDAMLFIERHERRLSPAGMYEDVTVSRALNDALRHFQETH